jgi:hypothetical protein
VELGELKRRVELVGWCMGLNVSALNARRALSHSAMRLAKTLGGSTER